MQYPILITSAIKPPPGILHTKLVDPFVRFSAVKCSVFFWVALGVKKIVFVDSTSINPFSVEDIDVIKKCGIDIEIVTYQQDEKEIELYGKGYGEGDVIRYAFKNSSIMKNNEYFYKITGKCFCRNFVAINDLIKNNKITSIFWRMFDRNFSGPDFSLIDTRFFFTSQSFFMTHLSNVYLEAKAASVERLVVPVLEERLISVNFLRPQISGFSGGHGGLYGENNLGQLEFSYPSLASK